MTLPTRLFLRDLRADDLHRLLVRRRDARTPEDIYRLSELFSWPREQIAVAIADLVEDGRLADTADGRLIVKRKSTS